MLFRSTLEKKRRELEYAERLSVLGGSNGRMKELNEEIRRLTDLEECMWSQRAKADWLCDGDQIPNIFIVGPQNIIREISSRVWKMSLVFG